MSDDNLNRIKSKIEKLFNLAEHASNEHEAANAMAKARKLMDEYQLTRVDILTVGDKQVEFSTEAATRVFANIPVYMDILAVQVAKFNDCQAVRRKDVKTFKANKKQTGWAVVFRGMKQDVHIATEMYDRLMFAVNNLCARWLVEIGHEGKYPVGKGGKFKLGAVHTINERLREYMEEREKTMIEQGKHAGTALVVVKGNAVAEYFGNVDYKQAKYNTGNDEDSTEAYFEGLRRGATVDVFHNVNGDKQKQLEV